MTKCSHLRIGLVLGISHLGALPGNAQMFAPTTAPAQNWTCVTASADGTILAAAGSYGYLYISTNSGATWTIATTVTNGPEPERPWTGLAMSADGTKLIAAANFNPVFLSTNLGKTWSQSGPGAVWAGVASSADGAKLVAVDNDFGLIYTSSDSGTTWRPTSAPNKRWRSVASSADGTKLVAGTDYGTNYDQLPSIYTSADSGLTWRVTSAPAVTWQSIACSADGTKLIAGAYSGPIYLSADSGSTWTAANVPAAHWDGVGSSTDGTKLVAAAWEGMIYVSPDSGRTWTSANAPQAQWQMVANSADGTKLFAGIWNIWNTPPAGIYSADIPPLLNISFSKGSPVLSWPSSALGFTLQESSDFTNPNWTDVPTTQSLASSQTQVTLTPRNGSHFYRLIHR